MRRIKKNVGALRRPVGVMAGAAEARSKIGLASALREPAIAGSLRGTIVELLTKAGDGS